MFGIHRFLPGLCLPLLVSMAISACVETEDAASGIATPAYLSPTTIFPSDGASTDYFGEKSAIDGNYVIVGAEGADGAGTNSGAAYIYYDNGAGAWSDEAILTASDAAVGDGFGRSVAISGDYAIVGAPEENGFSSNRGAVYIYQRTSGNSWGGNETILTASVANDYDHFGYSVAISGDYAIVGAPGKASSSGAVYIYRNTGGNTWGEEAILTASDAANGDFFGSSVAISGDYAIVGARLKNGAGLYHGGAYIYQRIGLNTWGNEAILTASDAGDDHYFGDAVAIDGDYAIVGTGSKYFGIGGAYVYQHTSGNIWENEFMLPLSNLTELVRFAYSVDIDGDTIVAGAPFIAAPGLESAYLYQRSSGNTWGNETIRTDPNSTLSDGYGASVGVSGTRVIVGASELTNSGGLKTGGLFVLE